MTTINFDSKLDAALENARSINEPTLSMGEYLKIVLEGYLTEFAKQWEPELIEARADLRVAEESVKAKYEPVKQSEEIEIVEGGIV
jgi:hypothetical protein